MDRDMRRMKVDSSLDTFRPEVTTPSFARGSINITRRYPDIDLRLCYALRLLYFSATVERCIKIKVPLQLGHLAFVRF
jgi:hypothetical protein